MKKHNPQYALYKFMSSQRRYDEVTATNNAYRASYAALEEIDKRIAQRARGRERYLLHGFALCAGAMLGASILSLKASDKNLAIMDEMTGPNQLLYVQREWYEVVETGKSKNGLCHEFSAEKVTYYLSGKLPWKRDSKPAASFTLPAGCHL